MASKESKGTAGDRKQLRGAVAGETTNAHSRAYTKSMRKELALTLKCNQRQPTPRAHSSVAASVHVYPSDIYKKILAVTLFCFFPRFTSTVFHIHSLTPTTSIKATTMKCFMALLVAATASMASATVDICAQANITNATAGYCSCQSLPLPKNPVAVIDCAIGEPKDIFYADINATLFPCAKTAEFVVNVSAMGKDYGSYECLLGQSEKIEIPGLTFDYDIGGKELSAQAYLEMLMKGNTVDFVAQVDLTFCATIWGVELCGDELSPSLPYNIVTGELTTSGICD